MLVLGNIRLQFQPLPPFSLLDVTLKNGFTEPFGKFFDPGCQRFYRLFVYLRTL